MPQYRVTIHELRELNTYFVEFLPLTDNTPTGASPIECYFSNIDLDRTDNKYTYKAELASKAPELTDRSESNCIGTVNSSIDIEQNSEKFLTMCGPIIAEIISKEYHREENRVDNIEHLNKLLAQINVDNAAITTNAEEKAPEEKIDPSKYEFGSLACITANTESDAEALIRTSKLEPLPTINKTILPGKFLILCSHKDYDHLRKDNLNRGIVLPEISPMHPHVPPLTPTTATIPSPTTLANTTTTRPGSDKDYDQRRKDFQRVGIVLPETSPIHPYVPPPTATTTTTADAIGLTTTTTTQPVNPNPQRNVTNPNQEKTTPTATETTETQRRLNFKLTKTNQGTIFVCYPDEWSAYEFVVRHNIIQVTTELPCVDDNPRFEGGFAVRLFFKNGGYEAFRTRSDCKFLNLPPIENIQPEERKFIPLNPIEVKPELIDKDIDLEKFLPPKIDEIVFSNKSYFKTKKTLPNAINTVLQLEFNCPEAVRKFQAICTKKSITVNFKPASFGGCTIFIESVDNINRFMEEILGVKFTVKNEQQPPVKYTIPLGTQQVLKFNLTKTHLYNVFFHFPDELSAYQLIVKHKFARIQNLPLVDDNPRFGGKYIVRLPKKDYELFRTNKDCPYPQLPSFEEIPPENSKYVEAPRPNAENLITIDEDLDKFLLKKINEIVSSKTPSFNIKSVVKPSTAENPYFELEFNCPEAFKKFKDIRRNKNAKIPIVATDSFGSTFLIHNRDIESFMKELFGAELAKNEQGNENRVQV